VGFNTHFSVDWLALPMGYLLLQPKGSFSLMSRFCLDT